MTIFTLIRENPMYLWIGLGIALVAVFIVVRLVKKVVNKVIGIALALIIGIGGGGYASVIKTVSEYGDQAAKAGVSVTEYIKDFIQ